MEATTETVKHDLKDSLNSLTGKWKEIGRILVEAIRELTRAFFDAYCRQQDQRGRFVHRHKGKALRRHRMPQYYYRYRPA